MDGSTVLFLMRAWLEVDLDVVARNYHTVTDFIGPHTKVLAVVKADAYGHGVEAITRVLAREGCPHFGVISIEEARQVRSVTDKPVLIMGFLDDAEIQESVREGYVLSLYDRGLADIMEADAARIGRRAHVHLKVETGMNRLGMQIPEALEFIANRNRYPNIIVESVFTHLAQSVSREVDLQQLEKFEEMKAGMAELGFSAPLHMTNSHGITPFPEGRFDYMRLGLALYGVEPVLPGLEPSLQAKTVVMQRKPLRKGEGTSYNKLFVAEQDMEIAILAMGYAEGLSQSMTGKIECLINGHRTRVIGQICMNLIVADVTGIPAQRGDEVVLIGRQGDEMIRVADVARQSGIRHHEILTRLGKSLPKVYLGQPNGSAVAASS